MTIRKLICEPVLGALLHLGLIAALGPIVLAQQSIEPLSRSRKDLAHAFDHGGEHNLELISLSFKGI